MQVSEARKGDDVFVPVAKVRVINWYIIRTQLTLNGLLGGLEAQTDIAVEAVSALSGCLLVLELEATVHTQLLLERPLCLKPRKPSTMGSDYVLQTWFFQERLSVAIFMLGDMTHLLSHIDNTGIKEGLGGGRKQQTVTQSTRAV